MKTVRMCLLELMVLKEDVSGVLLFLGKSGNFQFQSRLGSEENSLVHAEGPSFQSKEREMFIRLEQARSFLGIDDSSVSVKDAVLPQQKEFLEAENLIFSLSNLTKNDAEAREKNKRLTDAYNEAAAFSNLKQSYGDLEKLSFLSLRVGKIDPAVFDELKFAVGQRAVIVPLGSDKSRVLAASSKKGRFALDTELKKHGFVQMEIPKDFKGIPEEVLASLKAQKEESGSLLLELEAERKNFTETHKEKILSLLADFSLATQLRETESLLESTQQVCRLTGWVPFSEAENFIASLDSLTEGRISIRKYGADEVPTVVSGREKVPVKLTQSKFAGAFKRMIFSYGSPAYGSVDPTPFVAVFFTLLFGIMFGDAGQGFVFFLAGILMAKNVVKVGSWNKFAPIFIGIGVSSMIMGLLTGEFFATEGVLEPFSRFVTGLFGKERSQILPMMPQSDPESVRRMFMFFLFSVAVGFVINSAGIVINIVNAFAQKKFAKALFGKSGVAGAAFFWYVVALLVRVFAFKKSPQVFDFFAIGAALFFCAFSEVFERLLEGKRPVFENGFGGALIGAVVELLETVITYLSNSISFLRVGAFALAHAVLGFIISTMMGLAGGAGAAAICVLGNAIVIVLEGMIVAIQAVRLQYYEFFSKFFSETGREFVPFEFEYKK